MDHKFSEIDHVTPLFNLFLVVHLPTHSEPSTDMSKLFMKESRIIISKPASAPGLARHCAFEDVLPEKIQPMVLHGQFH